MAAIFITMQHKINFFIIVRTKCPNRNISFHISVIFCIHFHFNIGFNILLNHFSCLIHLLLFHYFVFLHKPAIIFCKRSLVVI